MVDLFPDDDSEDRNVTMSPTPPSQFAQQVNAGNNNNIKYFNL